MADTCIHHGPHWPAITHGLCLMCLDQLLAAYDQLMALLDTDHNLADPLVRQAWVAEVQARMADAAERRGRRSRMTDDPRPCPRRNCNGLLHPTEHGLLNGVLTTYWDCDTCGHTDRIEFTTHDEPTLDIEP
jgi:hypothetical protein